MKKARVFTLVLALCLIFTAFCPAASADPIPDITAENAIVMSTDGSTVLFEKNADSKAPPASTTKIMTVLLICEAAESGKVNLSDSVTAQRSDLRLNDAEASTAGIKPGEALSLRDLCFCSMLISANEASNVAARYVAGSVEKFVELMNDRAVELGCKHTHFTNTNGLPSDEHYTSARDLALITREALKHEPFRELCGTSEYTVSKTAYSKERKLKNSNALINADSFYGSQYLYKGAYGVKTGHTDSAGYCLVSAFSDGGMDIISVVLGSSGDKLKHKYFNNFADTVKLLDYCRENWHSSIILSKSEAVGKVPVKKGTQFSVDLSASEDISKILPKDCNPDKLEYKIEYSKDELTAPVKAGSVLGKVSVYGTDGNFLCDSSLIAMDTVEISTVSRALENILEFSESHLLAVGIFITVLVIAVFLAIYFSHRKKGKSKKNV